MPLLFARHGNTDWNIAYVIQGWVDVPLNETGISQAKALGEALKGVHIDRCFVSPLLRARQTAEIALEGKGVPITVDERIIEQYYGDYESVSRHDETYHQIRATFAGRYPNGEGYFDVGYRVYSFLHELEDTYPEETILVIAHGGMSRVVNSYFNEMNNEEFPKFGLHNCEVAHYEWPHRKRPRIRSPKEFEGKVKL